MPSDPNFEFDEIVAALNEAVDQDAECPWILDDGTDECYEIVARPSYVRQALYAATHNGGWTSFIDNAGEEFFINVNKLIAIAHPIKEE